jgi:CYTH domain-containing protein
MLEIERKFLFNSSLEEVVLLESDCCLLLIQWYLSPPDNRRIRLIVDREGARIIETVKTGYGRVRQEFEQELCNETLYDIGKTLRGERAVMKARYVFTRGTLEGVIDNYFVPAIGYVMEIETTDPTTVIPDPWEFWRLSQESFDEVTDRSGYTARDLSVKLDSIADNLPSVIVGVTEEQLSRFLSLTSIVYSLRN